MSTWTIRTKEYSFSSFFITWGWKDYKYDPVNMIAYIKMQLDLGIRRCARARLKGKNSGARFFNVRDEGDSSRYVSWLDIFMEIFGDTSSASLDQDRRLGGYSGRGGFRGEERTRQGGREERAAGMLGERPRNLLRAILPTTRRASGMGKVCVSLSLSRPRNVFYSDRRWDSLSLRRPCLLLFRVDIGFK